MPNFGKAGSLIDGFLKSPLSGLAPWILLSVLEDLVGISMIVAGIAGSALIAKLSPTANSNV